MVFPISTKLVEETARRVLGDPNESDTTPVPVVTNPTPKLGQAPDSNSHNFSQGLFSNMTEAQGERMASANKGSSALRKVFKMVKSFFFADPSTRALDRERQTRLMRQIRGNKNTKTIIGGAGTRRRVTDLRRRVRWKEFANRQQLRVGDSNANNNGSSNNSTLLSDSREERSERSTNIMLRREIHELKRQLKKLQREFKFSQEKNILFKKLLDDAQIDRSYLKSRRDIRNLEKCNVKPQQELPPSPQRKVSPLVTSSPIRKQSGPQTQVQKQPDHLDQPPLHQQQLPQGTDRNLHDLNPPRLNFGSRYPSIPEIETLTKLDDRTSAHDSDPHGTTIANIHHNTTFRRDAVPNYNGNSSNVSSSSSSNSSSASPSQK